MAADEMEEVETVPVVVVDVNPDTTTAKQILTGDNELSNLAMDDEGQLADLLEDIRGESEDGLTGTGFNDESFSDLLGELGRGDPTTPDEEGDGYLDAIEIPTYEPEGRKPSVHDLYDDSKVQELLAQIEEVEAPEDVKQFLRAAAYRHATLDFEEIAEFYAHASPEVQNLMEASALVVIDIDRAIEEGFVTLSKHIRSILEQNSEINVE